MSCRAGRDESDRKLFVCLKWHFIVDAQKLRSTSQCYWLFQLKWRFDFSLHAQVVIYRQIWWMFALLRDVTYAEKEASFKWKPYKEKTHDWRSHLNAINIKEKKNRIRHKNRRVLFIDYNRNQSEGKNIEKQINQNSMKWSRYFFLMMLYINTVNTVYIVR